MHIKGGHRKEIAKIKIMRLVMKIMKLSMTFMKLPSLYVLFILLSKGALRTELDRYLDTYT